MFGVMPRGVVLTIELNVRTLEGLKVEFHDINLFKLLC